MIAAAPFTNNFCFEKFDESVLSLLFEVFSETVFSVSISASSFKLWVET